MAEDTGDPIGLRDDGRVADGVAEAEEEAVEGAGEGRGAGDDDEGHGEREEDAGQVEVAEFAAGRLDHRRLGEAAEDQPGGNGGQHARRGDAHRDDGPPVGEGQVQRGEGHTAPLAALLVRKRSLRTVGAGELIGQVLVLGAVGAQPAAGVPFQFELRLAGAARFAAERLRKGGLGGLETKQ